MLATIFKCHKVYWKNYQEGVWHETKSLIIIDSHNFQDIDNVLGRFLPRKIGFIYLFINTVSYHYKI
jgi:hypothetical protein